MKYVVLMDDLHNDITYIGPCLLMVSLNHPISHRKCIGFADHRVVVFIEPAQRCTWSYEIPGYVAEL